MTTGSDVQTALNRLIRRRQRRQSKVITRPPVRGTSGEAALGEDEDASPPNPAGFVYTPFADEAVYGWGSPFIIDPPMGTVQENWNPSNLIYRLIDQVPFSKGTWQVTHQRPDLACGSQWWSDGATNLVSWRPIAGWRDLAASGASVPAGAQPVFQSGDVLTYITGVNRVCSVVHANGYLYVAHLGDQGSNALKPYVSRAPVTLGAGFQSVSWQTIGPLEEPGVDNKEYDAHYMDLRSDGAQCLANGVTYANDVGWFATPLTYEEYTADLDWGGTSFTLARTGDASVGATYTWYESAPGDTSGAARAQVQASSMPFTGNPPIIGGYGHSWNINFVRGQWFLPGFLLSWYERGTDAVKRLTGDLNALYEQHINSADNYAQSVFDIVAEDNVFVCNDVGGCVHYIRGETSGTLIITATWVESITQLKSKVDIDLKYDGTLIETIPVVDQVYENRLASGFYATVSPTGQLPCEGPQQLPCGEDPDVTGSKVNVIIDPPPSALGQITPTYSFTPRDVFNALDYEVDAQVLPLDNGDSGDAKGLLFQYGWDVTTLIIDDVDQLLPSRARRYWKLYDSDPDQLNYVFEYVDIDSTKTSTGGLPPSDGNHTTGPFSTEIEWFQYLNGFLNSLLKKHQGSPHVHYQPCIRHPDNELFVSFACGDGPPSLGPTYTYFEKFGGGDLVALTGLDQVTATDPRYTKLLQDGTSGPELVVAGKQSIAGIL